MGLRPCDFWALSPGEWLCLIADAPIGAAQGLSRDAFDALFAQFPDDRS